MLRRHALIAQLEVSAAHTDNYDNIIARKTAPRLLLPGNYLSLMHILQYEPTARAQRAAELDRAANTGAVTSHSLACASCAQHQQRASVQYTQQAQGTED